MGQYALNNPSIEGCPGSKFGCDEIWIDAEEKTSAVLNQIWPSVQSQECRRDVISYVEFLLETRLSCQVFSFGSVPLKTYLPDGDIDLTVIGPSPQFDQKHHSWAERVCKVLENEERIHVKEVKCIHAEVPVVKCLVENIIVDITFNQLGGLSTLCFLEEVDKLLGQDHLFKKSIILVKAWCFYESRILGAHYGLLSTYALEILVLYIFQIYHESLRGPLQVLYRFLQFFSKFDWQKFCLTPWGPVSLELLQDFVEVLPTSSEGEFLLSYKFLNSCREKYRTHSESNQGKAFSRKYMNLVDPLRPFNNLGRSVNSGNLVRMYSAFTFGAAQLEKLLQSPSNITCESLALFFRNTQKHCKGQRPDAGFLSFRANTFSDEPRDSMSSVRPTSENHDLSGRCLPSENHFKKGDSICTSASGKHAERPGVGDVSWAGLLVTSGEQSSSNISSNETAIINNGVKCYKFSPRKREDSLRRDASPKEHVADFSSNDGWLEQQLNENVAGIKGSCMDLKDFKVNGNLQKSLSSSTSTSKVNSTSSETGSVSSAEEGPFCDQAVRSRALRKSERKDMNASILEGNLDSYIDNLKSGWAYQNKYTYGDSRFIPDGFTWGGLGRPVFFHGSRGRSATIHSGVSVLHNGTILGSLPKSQKGTGTFLPTLNPNNERQRTMYSNGVKSPRRYMDSFNSTSLVATSKSKTNLPKRRDGPNRARLKKNGDFRFGENQDLKMGIPLIVGGIFPRVDIEGESNSSFEKCVNKGRDAKMETPPEQSWISFDPETLPASRSSDKDTPIEKLEFGSFGPGFLPNGLHELSEFSESRQFASQSHSFSPRDGVSEPLKASDNGQQKSFYYLKDEDFPPLS